MAQRRGGDEGNWGGFAPTQTGQAERGRELSQGIQTILGAMFMTLIAAPSLLHATAALLWRNFKDGAIDVTRFLE